MSGNPQTSDSAKETAKKDWMKANKVQTTSTVDELFCYHAKEQQEVLKKKEWQNDVHYFQELKISALALLKMVMHARSGGRLEVMGMLQGKILGNTMVCMDVFALPVEGTETRVNALDSAYEYMSQYFTCSKEVSLTMDYLSKCKISTKIVFRNLEDFDLFRFPMFSRLSVQKTVSAGITAIQDTVAGCLVLTSRLSQPIRCIKNRL